jgi:hypothetical protein
MEYVNHRYRNDVNGVWMVHYKLLLVDLVIETYGAWSSNISWSCRYKWWKLQIMATNRNSVNDSKWMFSLMIPSLYSTCIPSICTNSLHERNVLPNDLQSYYIALVYHLYALTLCMSVMLNIWIIVDHPISCDET